VLSPIARFYRGLRSFGIEWGLSIIDWSPVFSTFSYPFTAVFFHAMDVFGESIFWLLDRYSVCYLLDILDLMCLGFQAWKDFVGGSISGVAGMMFSWVWCHLGGKLTKGCFLGIVAGQPLDTIKVRLQTQSEHAKYVGIKDCAWKMIKNEGVSIYIYILLIDAFPISYTKYSHYRSSKECHPRWWVLLSSMQ